MAICSFANWREQVLPPEAAQLIRTAENAASPVTAAKLFADSLRIAPSNGPALYGLGHALLEQNRPEAALKTFRRLNAFFPDTGDFLISLASALVQQPNLRQAQVREGRAYAERATQLQPELLDGWYILSVLCHLEGDFAAALAAIRQAIARAESSPLDPERMELYQHQEIACTDALSVFSPLE